nr:14109_t:CDS:2 [Entrophospora candida]
MDSNQENLYLAEDELMELDQQTFQDDEEMEEIRKNLPILSQETIVVPVNEIIQEEASPSS